MTRNEEVKQRILQWEERNGKTLQSLNRNEWIEAMMEIMSMTRAETEEYLAQRQ